MSGYVNVGDGCEMVGQAFINKPQKHLTMGNKIYR